MNQHKEKCGICGEVIPRGEGTETKGRSGKKYYLCKERFMRFWAWFLNSA